MISNNQKINGDGNKQVGGDYYDIHKYFLSKTPITFFEKDIKNVIIYFSNKLNISNKKNDDIKDILKLEIKNKINNLSQNYFEIIKEDYMKFFSKIDCFLKDPKNKKYCIMYNNTIEDLQRKIIINRDKYECFEEIIEALYDYILDNNRDELNTERKLIWVFLHFMYCNCDIGKKEKI